MFFLFDTMQKFTTLFVDTRLLKGMRNSNLYHSISSQEKLFVPAFCLNEF